MAMIKICPRCGAFFEKNRWLTKKPTRQQLFTVLKAEEDGLRSFDLNSLSKRIGEKKKSIDVPVTVSRDEIEEQGIMTISVEYPLCVTCSRASSGYFEGILQLRNKGSRHYEEALTAVRSLISKNPAVFVSKTVPLKDGIDLYLSSNKFLTMVGKELESRFLAETNKSPSLFSRDRMSGKELHRLTLLARLPEFGVGDVVSKGTTLLYVTSILGGRLIGTNLKNHTRATLPGDAKLVATSADIKPVKVIKTKPRLEVLHPENYESTAIENPPEKISDSMRVLEIEGKLYAVP
jgi:nonsense-mediated mRNA decay protein 3